MFVAKVSNILLDVLTRVESLSPHRGIFCNFIGDMSSMWGSTTIPEVQDKVHGLWKFITRQVPEFQNMGLSHVLWVS